jgi:hypothetical protein
VRVGFPRSRFALLCAAGLVSGIGLASCGGDEGEGTTSKCPELPLYDIRNEDDAAAAQHAAERIDNQNTFGCVTGPGDSGANVTD